MKTEIEIKDEVLDELTVDILLDLADTLHRDIVRLRSYDRLSALAVEDLNYNLKTLKAVKRVYKYVTTRDKWSKFDEFE